MSVSAGGSAISILSLKYQTDKTQHEKTQCAVRARFFGFGRPGWRVVHFGGNATNTLNTGAFYVNANNTSSNDNVNIGGQLYLFC